jgi:hypothetical protein
MVLEPMGVEFGVALGEHTKREIWDRVIQPAYVHHISLGLLSEVERTAFRKLIRDILVRSQSDHEVWSRIFPEATLKIDDQSLTAGEFEWQTSPNHEHSNWLLRKYEVPRSLESKIGNRVRLQIHYRSFVPSSLVSFSFFTPWIVKGAQVRVVKSGTVDYFTAWHRVIPRGKVHLDVVYGAADFHEAVFSRKGVMFPDSVVEVRWQSKGTPRS